MGKWCTLKFIDQVSNQLYHCSCWFCSYLVTVMGLVVPWGMTLVIVDAYAVFVRCFPRQPRIIIILIGGDLVCAFYLYISGWTTWQFLSFLNLCKQTIFMFDLSQALSYLSLAAACSTASTTMFLHDADPSYCPAKLCTRYQLSATMAYLSWFLSIGSCLFNLWLLPSL